MNYQPDMLSASLKMFAALIFLMGGLWLFAYIAKRYFTPGFDGGDKPVKVLANAYLGVKKSVSLVEVPGAILVLGITGDNISLLDKIEDREIIEEFKNRESVAKPLKFSDYLSKFQKKKPKNT